MINTNLRQHGRARMHLIQIAPANEAIEIRACVEALYDTLDPSSLARKAIKLQKCKAKKRGEDTSIII
jgi:hypothetical protein